MKKLLRIITIVFSGLVLIILMGFGGFELSEHVKGKKYIQYLEKNIERVPINGELTFNLLNEEIIKSKVILVGEIHGFKSSCQIDVEFFTYLRTKHHVRHYFIEMDFVQAHYLNQYNQTGDKVLLKRILKNWVVNIGRENKDYFEKFVALRELYLAFPFEYIGNNNLSDLALIDHYLKEQTGKRNTGFDTENSFVENASILKLFIESTLSQKTISETDKWINGYLLKNLNYIGNDKYREEVLTENFLALYKANDLIDKKVYGFYGLGHTLLASLKGGYTAMAARLEESHSGLKDKILSMNLLFIDSYMTIKSSQLPELMRDKGRYSRLSTSYDNIFFSYLHGIQDIKRITSPYSKSIIRIKSKNSPYLKSRRLFTMSKILPMGQTINSSEINVTADYCQFLICVRNSDWAEPWQ